MATNVFYNFLDTPVASIAAGAEVTNVGNLISVEDVDIVAIQVEATGSDVGNASRVDVNLVGAVDVENFDTVVFATAELQMNGTDTVRQTTLVNVSGLKYLAIKSIKNNDGSYAVNNVQVRLGKTLV